LFLEQLELVNFRNILQTKVRFSPELNILLGDNAQGKTNLLEGIYFLIKNTSPRALTQRELVNLSETEAKVTGLVSFQGRQKLIEITIRPGQGREVKVGGKVASKRRIKLNLSVVHFSPDDLRIVKGEPRERRNFLNEVLTSMSPHYAFTVGRYRRTLKQRNAILRGQERFDPEFLSTLEAELAQQGSKIIVKRGQTLKELQKYLDRLSPSLLGLEVEVVYEPSIGKSLLEKEEELRRILAQQLEKARERDWQRGRTSLGPHRDELKFLLGKERKDARLFASQGEQRTLVLALKIAQAQLLKEAHLKPLLLLDDALSELDTEKKQALLNQLVGFSQSCQVILTATKPALSSASSIGKVFKVVEGKVFEG
jgi:DNA replication and repair protein RecF